MQYDESSYSLPPGFCLRHYPKLLVSTTATSWLAWASFLLSGSLTLFTDHGSGVITSWLVTLVLATATLTQIFLITRRGPARVWRQGAHYDAAVLSIVRRDEQADVRVRFEDAHGITRLMQMAMSLDDADYVRLDKPLRVAFLDGELTYHYLPGRPKKVREIAV